MTLGRDPRPLIAHVMFRFGIGGLENGVVNLINELPREVYRHAVIALTEITDFRQRIVRDDVQFVALQKPPGHALWIYPELFRLFRKLRPTIVHSRNLGSLEVVVPAWAAGVPVRIHGEHGRDVGDLDGSNKKNQSIRRIYGPFVTHFIALSRDLEEYLVGRVGVSSEKVTQIYNGVDARRFHRANAAESVAGCPFHHPEHWIVGTVGRMQAVKDQVTLAKAFIRALELEPGLRSRLRLVMVGEGPLRLLAQEMLDRAGVSDLAWLPGERSDVPEVMRGLNCFVLPSLAEGISNTILEAMASGLPVIATEVGGNADLVLAEKTGVLVPAADAESMSRCIVRLANDSDLARSMGLAGRHEVEQRFCMDSMLQAYRGVYDRMLHLKGCTV
ncbi:MAG: TIGR03088 family PEP-CTERM/XrtA system glycosyltransferase [Propionivibrio sp.]|uniref:TIGR03088 family PEP-CTERM/XrtA system glycosyltransferase n=1 Tax=Propionivibrio sp. TaxID=2212460 RepID=UPI0025D2181D|nr:TIGR03088 family PEP-CTERM/XrtA system glycosyltransferase [Propionivibrio sp.]MBK8401727.1 TIGR03088 family PEP-CTERM/XrtA system glycosyltransferase [Propionivibrio sp.]MBL0208228.1 TIGR03088 family PEP-CTERM/XrtA system glycosyltransferase [Propionivibrio sp.]